MSDSISTFVPYDATGRAVNLDIEYMYRCDGLKLKVIRFEYYKSDDADYNWFILAPIRLRQTDIEFQICTLTVQL